MAKTVKKTETVANTETAENNIPVEQEMSEQQEAILNAVSEAIPEGNSPEGWQEIEAGLETVQEGTSDVPFDVEGMTQDVNPPEPVRLGELDDEIEPSPGQIINAESLEAKWAEGTIDENGLIDAVERNDILPSQYKAITGEDYEGRDNTSNFQAYKTDLETRLKEGKLNSAGATLQVDSWLRAEKISQDEAIKLREYLGEQDTTASPKKKEIIEHYQPEHLSRDNVTAEIINDAYAAIKTDAIGIAADIVTADNENESNRTARLASAFADYAYLKMLENKLIASENMTASLWDYIVSEQVLGKPREPEKDNNGADIPGTGYDPYRDRKVVQLAKSAATKACLLAYGSVTGVSFGYISRDHATGKRFDPKMVFVEKPNTPVEDCFRAVCVPAKTVRPHIWSNKAKTTVQEGRAVEGWELVPVQPNDDDTLRYLSNDVATALYQHYFAGEELEYDVLSFNQKKIPTGLLIGSKKPGTPSSVEQAAALKAQNTQSRSTGGSQSQTETPTDVIKAKDARIAELEKDMRAGISTPLTEALNAIGAIVRDETSAMSADAQAILLRDTADLLRRRIMPETTNKAPANEVMLELVRLSHELDQLLSWDAAEGTWEYETDIGTFRYEIDLKEGKVKELPKVLRASTKAA